MISMLPMNYNGKSGMTETWKRPVTLRGIKVLAQVIC